MTWDEYYEKINDWAVSTAVNKMSSLEDMGTSDEVVDALNVIAFEDKKGADRLLNRALQHGIKFPGENLVEIGDLCSEDSFRKASSSNISGVDMLSKNFFSSFLKHTSLEEAEQEIRVAQDAIGDLNNELKALLCNKSVQLKAVKLSSAIDMWFDSDFMDCLVHMQINKVRKNIRRAIAQVETIKQELERL